MTDGNMGKFEDGIVLTTILRLELVYTKIAHHTKSRSQNR